MIKSPTFLQCGRAAVKKNPSFIQCLSSGPKNESHIESGPASIRIPIRMAIRIAIRIPIRMAIRIAILIRIRMAIRIHRVTH